MPSYTYRCHQCGQVESVFHGIRETPSPACEACGGLTEKIFEKPTTVIRAESKETDKKLNKPADEAHQCHSACVLHRQL